MISERRHEILGLIIEHYLRTGEPIGSKTLCELLPYSVSSATIRNEMAYLSQLGLLEQLHTSGGRVPSKASFRYYVDNIMNERPLERYEINQIDEVLSVNSGDPERLLAGAAKLLGEYSHCASLCCMLEDAYDCVQGIEIIPAGNHKAMLIMMTVGNRIKSSLVNIPCSFGKEFSNAFYTVTKEFFIGRQLTDINAPLLQSVIGAAGTKIFDLLPALTSLCSLCEEASESKLIIDGETNLLSHKELGSDVYRLLGMLTEKKQLIKLLSGFSAAQKNSLFMIGDENPVYEMKNTTTYLKKYNYGNGQKAVLGVIGSMRIDYENILPRIKYIMKTTDTLLNEGGAI